MFATPFRITAAAIILGSSTPAISAALPIEVSRQLPRGYAVLTSVTSTVGIRKFYLVALRSRKELPSERYLSSAAEAPARPLLIFERRPAGRYVLVGRNDDVIATADGAGVAGNGCDPFEEHHIAIKGSYFTVENFVACGAHWTIYVTFRFEPRVGAYVFDNERMESLKMNPSDDPNAEALIPDVQRVVRPPKGRLVRFSDWRDTTR